MKGSFVLLLFSSFLSQPGLGADSSTELLTLDRLFTSEEFEADPIPKMHWSRLSQTYFLLEESDDSDGSDLVRKTPEGVKEVVIPSSALVPEGDDQPLSIEDFTFSADESRVLISTNGRKVWRSKTRGDYWVCDLASQSLTKLGGDVPSSTLMFAKFSPDASQVAYVREDNLYLQNLDDHSIQALTTDGDGIVINGHGDWVNEEEFRLRDGFRWGPDGKQILFWQFDTSGVSQFHLINNTKAKTPQIQSFAYPKVGSQNSVTRLGVVSVDSREVNWIRLPGDPREHYLPRAEWTPDGSTILVQQFNRLQKVLKVWLVDPATGLGELVLTETDSAWIENDNPVRWLKDGEQFLWISERTGWRHAYIANRESGHLESVTQGSFDVIDVVAVDEEENCLYYTASPDNATQQYLYRVSLDGTEATRLSPMTESGWHSYQCSPDAKYAVHAFSTFSTPPVVSLVRLNDHTVVQTLTDNQELRERVNALQRPEIEFLSIDIGDGVLLDGWSLRPKSLPKGERFPLVMYVYGEPHGQTVRDRWGGPRGLWHWMLAQQGFVVASFDNRGTNVPKGRAWRKCVYRQIGTLASAEQARVVEELLNRWTFIDPKRVGSWGWSGGGSMSLNAIFRYPELYRTAIAIAPVADQTLYDTIYQERYMGLPTDNAKGYQDGSPLSHAYKLRGNLLVIHGTGDDNCHYQGTEKLINKLVAEGKRFTVLPYPNRSHSVNEGDNTTRHLWGTMTRFLQDNLQSAHAPEIDPAPKTETTRAKLQIFNGSGDVIDVFWLKSDQERVPNGTIQPNQNSIIQTTVGHQFVLVSRRDQTETIVTSKVPVQAFRFGGIPEFYTQRVDAGGFPIVASERVNPYALKEAVYIVDKMLAQRPDVRDAMTQSGARLCILAHDEFTTDQPEWKWLAEKPVRNFPDIPAKDYRDARARGMGGSLTDPYCSCAEENLLAYPGDPYQAENILIHELAHNIHLRGMSNVDPTFDTRVRAAYDAAMAEGLWKGKYASVNHYEYFAEGVQSWFDDNRENDHDHNHVNTRAELLEYDPRLAAVCREVFGDTQFRYTKPTTRLTGHLAGYDPQKAPRFQWPARLSEARKAIRAHAVKRSTKDSD